MQSPHDNTKMLNKQNRWTICFKAWQLVSRHGNWFQGNVRGQHSDRVAAAQYAVKHECNNAISLPRAVDRGRCSDGRGGASGRARYIWGVSLIKSASLSPAGYRGGK